MKEFSLEEAEDFIDNIYQHKFDDMEGILEDGTKVIYINGLDNLEFTDFECACFTLLRGEQRLKYQLKKQQEILNEAIKVLEEGITFCENDSQDVYDKCNIAIRREKKVLEILDKWRKYKS